MLLKKVSMKTAFWSTTLLPCTSFQPHFGSGSICLGFVLGTGQGNVGSTIRRCSDRNCTGRQTRNTPINLYGKIEYITLGWGRGTPREGAIHPPTALWEQGLQNARGKMAKIKGVFPLWAIIKGQPKAQDDNDKWYMALSFGGEEQPFLTCYSCLSKLQTLSGKRTKNTYITSRVRVCGKSVALRSYYSVVSTRCFLLIIFALLSSSLLALLAPRLLAAGVEEAVYGGVHVAVGRDQG